MKLWLCLAGWKRQSTQGTVPRTQTDLNHLKSDINLGIQQYGKCGVGWLQT